MKHILCVLVACAWVSVSTMTPAEPSLGAGDMPESVSYVESSAGLIPPTMEGGATELEMGDVNGDGNPDIVSIGDHGSPYVNTDEHGVMVWFGDGQGGWSVYQNGEFGYGGIALGDVNNDGSMDVGYGMHHNYSGQDFGDQLMEVALGDGTGMSWTPWDDGLASNGEWWGMFGTDFADVNHDGLLDIGSGSFGCCNGIHIYLNQGDGTWTQSWSTSEGNGYNNQQFTFGDVNGDGNPDLAAPYAYGTVYTGDGAGSFSLAQGSLPPAADVLGVALGDVNHDGRDELGIARGNGGVQVWAWVSPGTWQNLSEALPGSGPYELIQLADMDMDGNRDVIAFGNGQLRIWAGDGAGSWTEAASFTTPAPGYAEAFRVGVDADHNGHPDIALVADEGDFNSENHLRFFKEASTPELLEIKPITPSANQTYYAGSVVFVDWVSEVPAVESGVVGLEFSIHGPDGPWESMASNLPNNGRYQWIIPAETLSTQDAYIRYSLTAGGNTVQAITLSAFHIIGSSEEPIVGLTAANDSPTILNETTVLSATIISGTNIAYTWDLGDGSNASGTKVEHRYADLGQYTATVTATNSVSAETATTIVEVYEEAIGGLSVTSSSPTLIGDTTFFTAAISSGTNVTFTWDLGDGSTASGPITSHEYMEPGIYTATVTASNAVSSEAAWTPVEIQPLPPIRTCLPVVVSSGG